MKDDAYWEKYRVSPANDKNLKDDAYWEKYKVSEKQPMQPPKESFLAPLASLLAGGLQTGLDFGANIGNFALHPIRQAVMKNLNIPEGTQEEALRIPYADVFSKLPSNLKNETANLSGRILAGPPAIKGLNSALKMIPAFSKRAGFPGAVSREALLGSSISPDEYRVEGAALGGLSGALSQAPRVSNKAVGNQIVNKANEKDAYFHKRYEDFFDTAEKFGVKKVTRKGIDQDLIKAFSRIAPKDYTHSVNDFMAHPSLRNAHNLEKVVKSFQRDFEGKALSPSQRKAVNAAVEMQEVIQKNIENQLKYKGNDEIVQMYKALAKDYREEYVPYLNNQAIRNARLDPYQEDFMEAYRLPKELSDKSSDSFRRTMGHEHPELKINRSLVPAGALLGGGLTTYELLKMLASKQ